MTRLQRGDVAELTFVLPPAPGINSRHGTDPLTGQRVRLPGQYKYVPTAHGARPVLSAYARRWREQAALLVTVAARECGWVDPGGDLVVELMQRGAGRRDVDAGVKLALDSVAEGLGVNDRRFRRVVLEREREGAPCLAVRVFAWAAVESGAA